MDTTNSSFKIFNVEINRHVEVVQHKKFYKEAIHEFY